MYVVAHHKACLLTDLAAARVDTFLDLYGNAMITERTEHIMQVQAEKLERMLCDCDDRDDLPIGLSHLRDSEFDEIIDWIKWFRSPRNWDLTSMRLNRLRALFGDRFDSRANLIDLDYHNCPAEVNCLSMSAYKRWRLEGQAFVLGGATKLSPNPTFASYRSAVVREPPSASRSSGSVASWNSVAAPVHSSINLPSTVPVSKSVELRGYWCDCLVSPFCAFLPSDFDDSELSLYSTCQQRPVNSIDEIATTLITKWLLQFQNCVFQQSTPVTRPLTQSEQRLLETCSEQLIQAKKVSLSTLSSDAQFNTQDQSISSSHTDLLSLWRQVSSVCKLNLLGCDWQRWSQKQKLQGCIDHCFIGSTLAPILLKFSPTESSESTLSQPPFARCFAPNCMVAVETIRFLPVSDSQRANFSSEICGAATRIGWRHIKSTAKWLDNSSCLEVSTIPAQPNLPTSSSAESCVEVFIV